MSGSFIDSEIDSIVEKFSDEPVIKVEIFELERKRFIEADYAGF